MSKHQIPLIEAALAKGTAFPQTPTKHMRQLAPRARRFVFDTEASRRLGRFIGNCGDLILKNRQFAIPPYDVTYVEYDPREVIAGIQEDDETRIATKDVWPDKNADIRAAFLLNDDWIWEFSEGIEERAQGYGVASTSISPFSIRLNTAPNSQPLWHPGDWHEEMLARSGLFLGTSIRDADNMTLSEILSSTFIDDHSEGMFRKHSHYLKGWNGIVRNVWGALLLLNQPKVITLNHNPARGVLHRGKRVVYAAHSTVTVNLDGPKQMRRAFQSHLRDTPRAHEVRGHFRHYALSSQCEHVWAAQPHEDGRWKCSHCGGWRTWVREHLRGDSAKGFVRKDYGVTVRHTEGGSNETADLDAMPVRP